MGEKAAYRLARRVAAYEGRFEGSMDRPPEEMMSCAWGSDRGKERVGGVCHMSFVRPGSGFRVQGWFWVGGPARAPGGNFSPGVSKLQMK